jgi:hypothetical protein
MKLVPLGRFPLRDFDEPVALFEIQRNDPFGHPLSLDVESALVTPSVRARFRRCSTLVRG